jgi:hypothetical protein
MGLIPGASGGNGNGGSNAGAGGNGGDGSGGANGGGASGNGNQGAGNPASAGAASWRDSLPDELKNDSAISTYSDIAQLVKSHIHAQKMIGKDKIPVPGEGASEQDWETVFNKLGRPDSPDKYELKLPEGAPADDPMIKGFKALAHKSGILPKQAQAVMGWMVEANQNAAKAMAAQRDNELQNGIATLKREWGPAFDRELSRAERAVTEFGGQQLHEVLKNEHIPMDVRFALTRAFAKAGAALKEDAFAGGGNGGQMGNTPAEMKAKVEELMATDAYRNANHAGHKTAVDQVSRLFQAMHQ